MCLTALLIGLFVARPLINRMFAAQCRRAAAGDPALAGTSPVAGALPAPGRRPAAAPGADGAAPADPARAQPGIDLSQIDGQVRESSIKKIGEVVTRASRRSAGDHPHLAASTGLTMAKAAKPPVKEDVRSLSGAERAAIIMLSLGEDHSAKLWR